jgi:hypothetical protein
LVEFTLPESEDRHVLVDPCAGDGLAIATLRELWFGSTRAHQLYGVLDAHILAVELEKLRFKAAYDRLSFWDTSRHQPWDTVVEADAFHLGFKPLDGASVLYLNPPYDTDKIHGRLEQRFLARLTQCLAPGDGLLIFLVPRFSPATSQATGPGACPPRTLQASSSASFSLAGEPRSFPTTTSTARGSYGGPRRLSPCRCSRS